MKTNKKIYPKKILLLLVTHKYLVIFIGFLILSSFVRIDTLSDDNFFQSAGKNYDLLGFLQIRYNTWSTRFLAEGLLYFFTNLPIMFWRIANAAAWTLLIFSITNSLPKVHRNKNKYTAYIVVALVFAINASILASSGFQVTGSFNYILAVSLGIYSSSNILASFLVKNGSGGKNNSISKLIALPLTIFINEQVGLSILVIYILYVIYLYSKYRIIKTNELVIIMMTFLSLAIVYFAPGNHARLTAEVKNWYPNFLTISAVFKLKIFIIWVFTSLVIKMSLLLSVCGLIISYLVLKIKNKKLIHYLAAVIMLVPIALPLINTGYTVIQYPEIDKLFYSFDFLNVYSLYKPNLPLYPSSTLFYTFTTYSFWTVYMVILIYYFIKFTKFRGLSILMAFTASMGIFYFSPTLFASGNRILLLPSALIILIILPIINKIPNGYKLIILCISTLNIITLLLIWMGNGFTSIY